ncbi:alpha/beta hydrolase fold protein [Natronomonas moolapensis 8.8.11]|uniref:Alpha/beta hydrolase fold protein n=1 Tax=Natronomonas moolapensis (strain DSM 18674 / CECT 7526 / JCM 14361 / 8.8.11) TaxID=268739 RepID=M1XQE4_NATM8|nr:dienelactone hydrolase family protein [Natronomonas moolapensis]CCQ36378.1 alpha/beta hydrolase fold protein [Natronomonas moolapensis 8.8.11]
MSKAVVVPSDRDVRGTLDAPASDCCVVACPPHPQMGGSRTDPRLEAVSDALECACLRFDYGAWDGGRGELGDTRDALAWARANHERVGLFGYSFGGCLAVAAAARESAAGTAPDGVVALSPAARLSAGVDAVAALDDVACPIAVVYGERDATVDAEAVADRARARGGEVRTLPADHHFVGQTANAGDTVADLFTHAARDR